MTTLSLKSSSQQLLDDLFTRAPGVQPCREQVAGACAALLESVRTGGTILACGNGGSASDAEHLVGELMNRYLLSRRIPDEHVAKLEAHAGERAEALARHLQRAVPAIALVSQTSLATAIANDTSPEMVFAQQVYGYGRPGDVLVAISTSGNSPNVVYAAEVARAMGLVSVAMTGRDGGALADIANVCIRVPAERAFEVQELHLPVYHTLCAVVESELFGPET